MKKMNGIAVWILSGLLPIQIGHSVEQKVGAKVSFREAVLLSFSPIKKNKDFKKKSVSNVAIDLPNPKVLPSNIQRDKKNKRKFTLFLH